MIIVVKLDNEHSRILGIALLVGQVILLSYAMTLIVPAIPAVFDALWAMQRKLGSLITDCIHWPFRSMMKMKESDATEDAKMVHNPLGSESNSEEIAEGHIKLEHSSMNGTSKPSSSTDENDHTSSSTDARAPFKEGASIISQENVVESSHDRSIQEQDQGAAQKEHIDQDLGLDCMDRFLELSPGKDQGIEGTGERSDCTRAPESAEISCSEVFLKQMERDGPGSRSFGGGVVLKQMERDGPGSRSFGGGGNSGGDSHNKTTAVLNVGAFLHEYAHRADLKVVYGGEEATSELEWDVGTFKRDDASPRENNNDVKIIIEHAWD
eukprot:gene6615-7922_t